VLYLQWWNSFLNEWAELASDKEPDAAEPPPVAPPAAKIEPPAQPKIQPQAQPPAHPPEEKYHYLTQYGTQILCLMDAEKGCLYLSSNFPKLTGLKAKKCLGKDFYGIIHGDFRARFKSILANTKGKPAVPFRCKLQHDDKKWYWHQFNIYPKKEGGPGEFVCIIENINDSMLAQNTLQKAKLEAELALRARSEFLANMSHELRTPLNAVIGFSQIIESEMFGKINNPQYVEYVKHIQESGYDLLAKIEDMLEIANIDAGRVQLSREEVSAGDILRQVAEAQKHHANAAKINLIPEKATDLLLHVDRLKLQHILGHLVANAIKHSSEGSRVTIACKKTESSQVEFTVHDNGSGMSDVKLAAIITALQEEHCWASDSNRNIGLGLALTREFAALHGGRVAITSTPGKGTTVTVNLPKNCIRIAAIKKPELLKQLAH